MRPFHALPLVDARSGPFATEEQIFDAIVRVYRDHGLAAAGNVSLSQSDEILMPFCDKTRVVARRFLGGAAIFDKHMTAFSAAFYGGRLDDFVQHFESKAQAVEAYHAFMATLLAHEVAHGLSHQLESPGRSNHWTEETRAIAFEYAVMRQLVATGRVPQHWLGLIERFNRALLAGAPAGLVDALPKAAAEREPLFIKYYPRLQRAGAAATKTGKNPDPEATDTVLALYTLVRLEVGAGPNVTVAALKPRLEPSLGQIAARQLARANLEPVEHTSDGHLQVKIERGKASWILRVQARQSGRPAIVLRSSHPDAVAIKRRSAVAELLMRANEGQELSNFRINLDSGDVTLRSVLMIQQGSVDAALQTVMRKHIEAMEQWHGAIGQVATQGAAPAKIANGILARTKAAATKEAP